MKINSKKKHIFSLYYENFLIDSGFINIQSDIFFRLKNVLRANINDVFIFFNKMSYTTVEIHEITKKGIFYNILHVEKIVSSGTNKLIAYVPILDMKYLTQAVYSLAKTFVTDIYFVETDFSRKKNSLNYDKLFKCLIQGAEESKNYSFPTLHKKVYSLSDVFDSSDSLIVFYEYAERTILNFGINYSSRQGSSLAFVCGPEEGFSEDEIQELKERKIDSVRLHSLILKSVDVIAYAGVFLSGIIEKKS